MSGAIALLRSTMMTRGLGILAEDLAKPRRHFGRRLDAGETAAGHDDRVASVHGRPLGEAMQVLVEGNRIVERVDAEAVLGKAGNVRTEQPAAGGHDQPVVGERLPRAFPGRDLHRAGLGVDRLGAALHIDDVDGLEHIEQRRGEGLGLRLVEPRANHQRRLGATSAISSSSGETPWMSRRRAAERAAYMPAKPAPMMTSRM